VAVGLIVNELVTNAYKHAFPGDRGGVISVEVVIAGSAARVTVRDDGIGVAEGSGSSGSGLGQRIVKALASQIGGTVASGRPPGGPGFEVSVTFPA
ncbi:MAG: sensor histidine kinase, partial [Methylobacteriaceae bacterium]|nr:sensor histidine kinase [Methylobacteriaceae bacterium]